MTDVALASRPLTAAARSDAGRVRTNNEDLAVLDAERGVFGVIDGVGGHVAGELAASIARDVIAQRLARPLGTPAERVREAIALANNEIFRRAQETPTLAGMTCVVTLALVADRRLTVGHVGDTRLYKLRPDGLRKLTRDHSPVGEREDAHEIDELDAMRHPRRHEVFRDVGSALRDKDEPDYVEVVEDVFEDDAALLVCSDGLTDMIPSTTIERVVRRHAGDADAVTAALVTAANEAGGRDNVTVVYAEGPAFAAAVRGMASHAGTVTAADDGTPSAAAPRRWTWFAAGLLLGLLVAGATAWRLLQAPPVGGRTIVAGPIASETIVSLPAALAAARTGDTIRLEPGTYQDAVVVPEGVSLRARVPGTATFTRPAGASGEWVAITLRGGAGGALSGVRVTSSDAARVDVGIRVVGEGRSLELVQLDGPMVAAIDLAAEAAATLHGVQARVPGPALVLGAGAELDVTGSILASSVPRGPGSVAAPVASPTRGRGRVAMPEPVVPPGPPAIVLGEGARLTIARSVLAGFGSVPVRGLPDGEWERLRADNVIMPAATLAVR